MSYVKVVNGTPVEYPYSLTKLRKDNPSVSFPSEIPNETLALYGVYPVLPAAKPVVPSDKKAVENMPVYLDGAWRQAWRVTDLDVPSSITPRQCRLILLQQGLLSQVEAMIAQSTEDIRITWEYALEFKRDDPLLTAFAASLQPPLSDEQLDQFFIAAAQL